MDTEWIMTWFFAALVTEILQLPIMFILRKRWHARDWSHRETEVMATSVRHWTAMGSDHREYDYTRYEYEYQGRKRHFEERSDVGSYTPDRMSVVVDKRTGRKKIPEAVKREQNHIMATHIISVLVGVLVAYLRYGRFAN